MHPIKKAIIALIIILPSLPFYAYAAGKNYSSVEDFVRNQTVIRVLMDNTPGLGNQTASINAMNRLRQIGFNGQFEVIYSKQINDKVLTLFNLPAKIPDDYFDVIHNIHFVRLGQHAVRLTNGTLEKITLGIDGGDESDPVLSCHYNKDETQIDPNSPVCLNRAKFLGVEAFAEIGPFTGHVSYLYLQDKGELKLTDSKSKYFVTPVATLNDAKTYLENDPRGQILLQQKPALKTLIDGIEKHAFNVQPIYGFSVQNNENNKTTEGAFPNNMLQILAGSRFAQLKASADGHKPLIIPVFYDYKTEMQELMVLLRSNHWGAYEKPGVEVARKIIKTLGLADALQIASISDANAMDKIQQLQVGQILLLSMEPLPKTVFDGIYNHTDINVLPAIREGANTFNSLILTGKPHFRCTGYFQSNVPSWEIGYDLVKDAFLKNRFTNFYNGFCAGDPSNWVTHQNLYRELGDFIIESSNTDSAVSQYFATLKIEALKPENDKVRYVVGAAMKALYTK